MSQSRGRAAFDAYHTRMQSAKDLSDMWDSLLGAERSAWEKAAIAAVDWVAPKSLGQVAFEAYWQHSTAEKNDWPTCPAEVHADWERVAEAVRLEVEDR